MDETTQPADRPTLTTAERQAILADYDSYPRGALLRQPPRGSPLVHLPACEVAPAPESRCDQPGQSTPWPCTAAGQSTGRRERPAPPSPKGSPRPAPAPAGPGHCDPGYPKKSINAVGTLLVSGVSRAGGRRIVIDSVQDRAPIVGMTAACGALGVPRSTVYRRRRPARGRRLTVRRRHPRALSPDEQIAVRDVLNSERFVDQAPRTVYATLLDEGQYL